MMILVTVPVNGTPFARIPPNPSEPPDIRSRIDAEMQRLLPPDQPGTETVPRYEPAGNDLKPAPRLHLSNLIGGGGIVTTADDMAIWGAAVLSRRNMSKPAISAENLAYRVADHLLDSAESHAPVEMTAEQ